MLVCVAVGLFCGSDRVYLPDYPNCFAKKQKKTKAKITKYPTFNTMKINRVEHVCFKYFGIGLSVGSTHFI